MLARVAALTLAFGLLALILPGPVQPVGEASAVCIEDPVTGDCLPVCEAAGVYEDARRSNPLTEKILPELHCVM